MPAPSDGDSRIDRWKPFIYLGILLCWWGMIAALWQGGWPAFWSFWGLYFKVALVGWVAAVLVNALREGPTEFVRTAGLGGVLLWMIFAGSFRSWQSLVADLLAAALALLATLAVMRGLTLARDRKARSWEDVAPAGTANLGAVVWSLLAWLFLSGFSLLRSGPLPTDPSRFARLAPERSIAAESARRWQGLRIGLALSGGGYRAAVFHAGTLQALEDLGVRVTNLSTVSGGSIIGAYYAVGGDPRAFVEAVGEGRFNLKRELMLVHNAVGLLLPMKLPSLDVELLPLASFDRLDVQRKLLERTLFSVATLQGGIGENEADMGQPRLMIAATDLTYGFQIGFLSDGILKLGDGVGGRNVYRGNAYKPAERLSLADRVAISGAFPLAFPARALVVKVIPADATGRGERPLLLVDGGIRDNLGLDLLRVADSMAEPEAEAHGVGNYLMPQEWDLDAILASDGGAVLGVMESRTGSLSLLSRAFEVAGIETYAHATATDRCAFDLQHPPTFSAASQMLPPDTQFNLKNDSADRAALERQWSVWFDPAHYPEPVLRRLVEQLPKPQRSEAEVAMEVFLTSWSGHRTRDRTWSKALHDARCPPWPATTQTQTDSAMPGVCEALRLRELVREGLMASLEVFRATSTLDDRISAKAVDTLEGLGKILVYLEWPRLEQTLDLAATDCS